MKRREFLTLPVGTVYCQGRPWVWGDLRLKAELASPNDWWEQSFNGIEAESSNELVDRYEAMLADPTLEYPLETSIGRDGLYLTEDSDDDLFLVFSDADVECLIEALQNRSPRGDTRGWSLDPEARGDGWAFIQWKGTNVCMDLTCLHCGERGHVDDYFAYEVVCSKCGGRHEMKSHVAYRKMGADEPERASAMIEFLD